MNRIHYQGHQSRNRLPLAGGDESLRALAQAAITASLPLSGGDESMQNNSENKNRTLAPRRRGCFDAQQVAPGL